MFPDENRRKTRLRNNGEDGRNDSLWYGSSYALMAHVYDTPE